MTAPDSKAECGKGWTDRCANAKGRKCRCRCGGHNHGSNRQGSQLEMFSSKPLTDRAVIEYPLGHPPERMELAAVVATDPRVIVFARVGRDEPQIGVRNGDALAITPLRQELVRHSPTGLEFGYGGSGPADTALNILSLVLPAREAWRLHQRFKAGYVAAIPREGGTLHMSEVRGWIAAQYRAELADAAKMADEREMRELLAEIETEERAESEARG